MPGLSASLGGQIYNGKQQIRFWGSEMELWCLNSQPRVQVFETSGGGGDRREPEKGGGGVILLALSAAI